MLPDYADITSRVAIKPLWYDEHGVPRYDPFTPLMLGVYDEWALYAEIACQDCKAHLFVGVGWEAFITKWKEGESEVLLTSWDQINPAAFHYGDPPRHDCPGAGENMNCLDLRVVEAWHRTLDPWGWERCEEQEGPLEDADDEGGPADAGIQIDDA